MGKSGDVKNVWTYLLISPQVPIISNFVVTKNCPESWKLKKFFGFQKWWQK